MATLTTISREEKIAAINLALAFAVGDAKELRYGPVQSMLNRTEEELACPFPVDARMDAALKVPFPDAEVLDDVSTSDIREMFATALRSFEEANALSSMLDN
jgi:hypothetical protein